MLNKKIFMFLLIGMFLISFSSAGLFDPSSELAFHEEGKNGKYGYYEINDTDFWIFNNNPIKTIQLIENGDSVLSAWNIKEIKVFKPSKLFDKTNYLDKKQEEDRRNKISSELHLFREWEIKTRTINNKSCLVYETTQNLTEICLEWENNYYEETYEEWSDWKFYNFQAVQEGLYQTKTIVTRANQGTGAIEWVDENEGYSLDKWAIWWNNSWDYKRQLNVTETSGNSYTNYSTLIYINYTEDTNSNANANFSDLRFLNSTESGELDYYIENKTDSSFAWVWVEVPSLTASSTSTIYMYYGNVGANTASSIFNTFIYGNDGTVNDFTNDLGAGGCTTNITDSSILHFCPASASWESSGFNLPTTYTTGTYKLIYFAKADDAQRTDGSRPAGFGLSDNTVNSGATYEGMINSDLNHNWVGGAEDFQIWDGSTQIVTTTSFYDWNKISQVVTPSLISETTGANITIINSTGTTTAYNGAGARGAGTMNDIGYIRTSLLDDSIYLRNITFREKASSEPTFIFGIEQISQGVSTILISPENNENILSNIVDFNFTSTPTSVNLTNATLYIWQSNGTLLYTNFTSLSGNESVNTSFTNTLEDGNYIYNAETCGDVEDCSFSSTNNSFTVHVTPITINITEPVGLIDYIKAGDNQTLSWELTEPEENLSTHLSNCSYTYNSIITYLSINTCIVTNTTNFTYVLGVNNLTFNTTDIFNLNSSSTTTWDLLFNYWDIDYATPLYESTQGIFVLNTSLLDGKTIQEAIFSYNGTNYTTSIITSGGNYLVTASILLPSVVADTNFTFSFYVVVDGITYNFAEETQEVLNINFVTCVGQDLLMNISLFDEGTKASILGDVELNIQVYSKTSNDVVAEINNTYENISSQEICLSPNASFPNLFINAEMRYFSDGYVTEFYNIQNADLTDYPINLSLFSLNQSDSTEFSITYKNNAFILTEGAIIQLQRKYIGEDSYEVVEAPTTSNGGTAVLHIDLNTNKYRASVVKDGELLDFFDNIVFSCANELSGDCTYALDGTVDPNNDISIETITDFAYSISISEDNQTVTVLFAVPSGTPSTINVLLNQIDMFGNSTSCNTTVITSAGSITCDYADTIEKSILELTISKNDVELVVKSYANDPDLDMDGMNFFIVFLFMISLVGMAIASPEWMIIISVMVLIISGTLLLLKGMNLVMGLGAIAWVVVAAAIIIFKMAKQEDR